MTEPDTPAPPPLEPEPRRSGLRQVIRDGLALDRRAVAILVTVPVVLTLLEYYGLPWHYTRYVERPRRNPVHSITTFRNYTALPSADPPSPVYARLAQSLLYSPATCLFPVPWTP